MCQLVKLCFKISVPNFSNRLKFLFFPKLNFSFSVVGVGGSVRAGLVKSN